MFVGVFYPNLFKVSRVFCGFFQTVGMSIFTDNYFDRDVPLDKSCIELFRGRFPFVDVWPSCNYAQLRQAKNGFRNLTKLNVSESSLCV